MTGPIPDSYWVEADKFLAGEYPRDRDEASSRAKLRRLVEAGVSFVLDLTQADEYGLKPYGALLEKVAADLEQTVAHHRMSIRDMDTPSPAQMKQILDTIDAQIAAGQVVYLHCFGGIGRTGTVVGCYLVRRGLSGDEALAEIARMRQGTPDGWRPSPETEAQRQMVRHWTTLRG